MAYLVWLWLFLFEAVHEGEFVVGPVKVGNRHLQTSGVGAVGVGGQVFACTCFFLRRMVWRVIEGCAMHRLEMPAEVGRATECGCAMRTRLFFSLVLGFPMFSHGRGLGKGGGAFRAGNPFFFVLRLDVCVQT